MNSKALVLISVVGSSLALAQSAREIQPTAPNPSTCEGQPGASPLVPQAPGAARGRGTAAAQAPAATSPTPREAQITAIPGIIAADAKFTQVWQTVGNNADGIIALPDGSVLVNQEDNSAVVRLDQNDKASIFLSDTHGSGSLSLNRQGQILAVQRLPMPGSPASVNPSAPKFGGISILYPERRMLANKFSDGSTWMGRPNDLAADNIGGAYFSQGCVYYAGSAGQITLAAEDIRSNGIVLSADEKTLYVTNGGTLSVFDVPSPGKLTNRREWKFEAGGNGDGSTIDAQGRVYVSTTPGVQIFGPEGKYLGLIPTPRALTGTVFAGPGKRTLYVVGTGSTDGDGRQTSSGATGRTIYRIPMLAEGLPGRSK
jgi:gluconolactonase